jgi:S-adenosylmethionine:tRNA ribosyltransferase-isomerase
MHPEWGSIPEATAHLVNDAREKGGRIVAVGTTSLRMLESGTSASGTVAATSGEIDLFIAPGYRFKAVDVLITNFHLPRSTLFMLVCAFSGIDRMKQAYRHAVAENYRFYSYGDASLLFPMTP